MIRQKKTDPFLYCQPEKKFVEELKKPVHAEKPPYFNKRAAEKDEVLTEGLCLKIEFEDALLETAYADFRVFAEVYGIEGERYPIIVRKEKTSVYEEYRIVTDKEQTVLSAGDTEGIRRGLVYLEDEMRRREGAFLPKGETVRTPRIRSRITHCFFAPINRPPNNGEELGDDVDYYPDEYLNRLAHDGSNGVWIYTVFKDLLPSAVIPEYGHDSQRRLDKLNRTVEKCKRYGIKVFVFAIEPAALRGELTEKYPDIMGTKVWDGSTFCTASERGKAYCKDAFETLFRRCPDIGGVLVLSNGERTTNCSSNYEAVKRHLLTCPNCRDKEAGEILAQAVDAMCEGMRAVKPEAEFLSWTYGHRNWEYEDIEEYVRLAPDDVALVQGFEDNGSEQQLGKDRMAIDYWLSYIGPSEMFKRTAAAAKKYNKTLYTKIQVCCSHEVATVPYLPVPGILFDKYKAMYELNVRGVVQCWYFGNYPSLMNKAAGEFAFLHDYSDKQRFLRELAGIYWGRTKAETVVKAWMSFEEGYRNYPLNVMFSYYGPMHDGPVWLLQPIPKNFALPRTWQYGDPMDGDRINEALLRGHTLEEAVTLAEIIHENWEKGMELMTEVAVECANESEQLSVMQALNCQFESGMHILKFYLLRDQLGRGEGNAAEIIAEMEALTREEILISRRLAKISAADNRLGFHTEAEGFRYFPEKLEARAQYLERLFHTEFAEIKQRIAEGKAPFEYYEGIEPGAPRYKMGSGWTNFSEGGAQLKIDEDENDIIIEFRSPENEDITISPEMRLFEFEPPVTVKTDGKVDIPWQVWMYFSMQPDKVEKEKERYRVKLMPSTEEYPGSHYEVRLNKEKFGYSGGVMKLGIHGNTYWRKPIDERVYLGKYNISPETYVWIDR